MNFYKVRINIIQKMGNYNCCASQKQTKKSFRIKSIKTTFSCQSRSQIVQRKNLLPQFIDNFLPALTHLQKNRSCFLFNLSCFNVTLESKIGKGAHSDVYLIKTDYQTNFMEMALKIIPKDKIKSDSLRKSATMQNLLMAHHCSPFLLKSYMSREDQNNIYYFCPVAQGGDLLSFNEVSSGKGSEFAKAEEENIRFVLAGIILGLEYLHKIGIILNDLKLQNILIDKDGYPMITDFGLVQPQNCKYFEEIVGTITYFSPQKLHCSEYTRAVDFWALGILIYTMIYHEYPFDKELFERGKFLEEIRSKQYKHKKMSPKGSQQLKDLINSLLVECPQRRLGVANIDNLKQHKFFKSINWIDYHNKTIKSPLKPIIEKYPLKISQEQVITGKVKIFRNCSLEDEFLWPIEETMKLKRSLCSTIDRRSNEGSLQYLSLSPLHNTTSGVSPISKQKRRKKSVSFDLVA